jgi:hypothetical protein
LNIDPLFYFMAPVAAVPLLIGWFYHRYTKRLAHIEAYTWPPGLISKLRHTYPHLRASDEDKIARGLKQFFRAYLNCGRHPVAMPSQAADELWHEFILYTKAYGDFCQNAFGRFLHHTPAIVLTKDAKSSNEGLRRVWWQACKEEGIDPRNPMALPLLFRLDAELEIPGGYRYTPDCKELREQGVAGTNCGGDFSSSSFDGGTSGLGDGDGTGSDGGGDGGGCGGD